MERICENCKYIAKLNQDRNVCQVNPPTVLIAPIKSTKVTELKDSQSVIGAKVQTESWEFENQIMSSYPPVMNTHSCSKFMERKIKDVR